MSTVPPSAVKPFDAATLEKTAYTSVANVPTREPNDQYRLGYSVWSFLSERKGTLDQAVHTAGSRLLIPEAEAVKSIRAELAKAGIEA